MITFIYKYTKLSTDHETPPNLLYILHFRTEVFIMTIGKEKKGPVRVWKRPKTLLYIHIVKNAVSRECFTFDKSFFECI